MADIVNIDHNATCLLPQNFTIIIVFDFSWDDCNTQQKLEIKRLSNFFLEGGWGEG